MESRKGCLRVRACNIEKIIKHANTLVHINVLFDGLGEEMEVFSLSPSLSL